MTRIHNVHGSSVRSLLSDLVGDPRVMAIAFNVKPGKLFLDWELRVPKPDGFFGYDASQPRFESLFETAVTDVDTDIDAITAMLAEETRWITSDEMLVRKSFARGRTSETVRDPQPRITAPVKSELDFEM